MAIEFAHRVEFSVLGDLEVTVADRVAFLGGRRQQALLARLLLDPGRSLSADVLAEDVWGSTEGSLKPLRMAVARLRGGLADAGERVRTVSGGYSITVHSGELDRIEFEHAIRSGIAAYEAGSAAMALELVSAALSLWRGQPLRDLRMFDWAVREADRLNEWRLRALELRAGAVLALGGGPELLSELASLAFAYPTREHVHGQLMIALYRDGRQVEALEAFQRIRHHLFDRYGILPSVELRALNDAIIRQDEAFLVAGLNPHPGG